MLRLLSPVATSSITIAFTLRESRGVIVGAADSLSAFTICARIAGGGGGATVRHGDCANALDEQLGWQHLWR
jgi:hypothetical protein